MVASPSRQSSGVASSSLWPMGLGRHWPCLDEQITNLSCNELLPTSIAPFGSSVVVQRTLRSKQAGFCFGSFITVTRWFPRSWTQWRSSVPIPAQVICPSIRAGRFPARVRSRKSQNTWYVSTGNWYFWGPCCDLIDHGGHSALRRRRQKMCPSVQVGIELFCRFHLG
jgi:hypothetical protein